MKGQIATLEYVSQCVGVLVFGGGGIFDIDTNDQMNMEYRWIFIYFLYIDLGPLLLTWFNFNPSIDK